MTLQNHTQLCIHPWFQKSEDVLTFHKTMQNSWSSAHWPQVGPVLITKSFLGQTHLEVQWDSTRYWKTGNETTLCAQGATSLLPLGIHNCFYPSIYSSFLLSIVGSLLISSSLTIFSNGSLTTYSFSTFLWVTPFCLLLSNYWSLRITGLPVHRF